MPTRRRPNDSRPKRAPLKPDQSLIDRILSFFTKPCVVCISGTATSEHHNTTRKETNDLHKFRLKEESTKLRPWNSDEALFKRRKHVLQTNKTDLLSDDSVSLDHKVDVVPDINVPLVRNMAPT